MKPKYPGKYYEIARDGSIVNDSSIPVDVEVQQAIEFTVGAIHELLQGILHSVYLRGSVARRTSDPKHSDFDVIAITRVDTQHNDRIRARKSSIKRNFKNRFPMFSHLDLSCVDLDYVLNTIEGNRIRFVIKTQGVCLTGIDLIPDLPEFYIDSQILFAFVNLNDDVMTCAKWIESERNIQECCRWVMRKIIRAAGEIGMLRTKRYTRDLGLCLENYLQSRGSQIGSVIPQALRLALKPRTDPELVKSIMHRAAAELQAEMASKYPDFYRGG